MTGETPHPARDEGDGRVDADVDSGTSTADGATPTESPPAEFGAGAFPDDAETFRARPESHPDLPADGSLQGPAPDERPSPPGSRTAEGVRLSDAAEADDSRQRRVLSAVVDHEPGVLASVSGLFSRRMFNIESLTVGPTADEAYARMTIVVDERGAGIEQARKQLAGLPTVHLVRELHEEPVERELALIKVDCDDPGEVESLAKMHDGDVVDVCQASATVQVTGTEQEIDNAIAAFGRFRLREVSRTGTTALERNAPTVYEDAHHGDVPPDFESTVTDDHAVTAARTDDESSGESTADDTAATDGTAATDDTTPTDGTATVDDTTTDDV
mgnify:CR=1 FL=1